MVDGLNGPYLMIQLAIKVLRTIGSRRKPGNAIIRSRNLAANVKATLKTSTFASRVNSNNARLFSWVSIETFLVDGDWEFTGKLGTCTENCWQKRHRSCTNPRPKFGGRSCSGQEFTRQSCNSWQCIGNLFGSGKTENTNQYFRRVLLWHQIHREGLEF